MTTFVKRFSEALKHGTDVRCLHSARDAFTGISDADQELCNNLQSDADFLSKILDKVADSNTTTAFSEAALELIFVALYTRVPATVTFVRKWLNLMKTSIFMTQVESTKSVEYDTKHTSFAITITLLIIASAKDVALRSDTLESDIYLGDPGFLIEMHDIILQLSSNNVSSAVCMAWGMYLHNTLLGITGDDPQYDEAYQSFVDHVFSGDSVEPHRYLIELALRSTFPQMDMLVHDLRSVKDDRFFVVLLEFFLSTQQYVEVAESTSALFSKLVRSRALANIAWASPMVKRMADSARKQFPHEYRPMLLMVKALAHASNATIEYMDDFPTFTQELPIGFTKFETLAEESNQTVIQILQPLRLFKSQSGNGGITIAPNSRGIMVKIPHANSVVLWQHQYSALQYLATVLECSTSKMFVPHDTGIINDIVSLFGTLLAGCDDAEGFLQHVSEDLNRDLREVVFDIFEQALQARGDTTLLVACASFFENLMKTDAETAWTYVSRFSIFDDLSNSRNINDIILSRDEHSGHLLLVAVCRVVQAAISDLISNALNTTDRLKRVKTTFMTNTSKIFLDLFQSYLNWPVTDVNMRLTLGTRISHVLRQIVRLGRTAQLKLSTQTAQVYACLDPGATYIIASLNSSSNQSTTRLMNFSFAITQMSSSETQLSEDACLYIEAVLQLYGTLISTTSEKREDSVSRPLQQDCFFSLLVLLRLMRDREQCRSYIAEFLVCLLKPSKAPLPSILSRLGKAKQELSDILTSCLDEMSTPSEAEHMTFWQLIDSFFQPSQEGIALHLLEKKADRTSSVLLYVIKYITTFDETSWSPAKMSQVLRVLVSAQYWAVLLQAQLLQNAKFWTSLTSLFQLCSTNIGNQGDEIITVNNSYRLACAGFIARAIATMVNCADDHHRKKFEADTRALVRRMPPGSWTIEHFRASLHGNLTRNVSQKYAGFSLQTLAKSHFMHSGYGESFFYDLTLAEQLIPANSFLRELRIANFNLSLVDAQALRLQGLHILIATISLSEIEDDEVWNLIRETLASMLKSDSLNVPLVPNIESERAEVTSLLMTALCRSPLAKSKQSECVEFLNLLLQLLVTIESDSPSEKNENRIRLAVRSILDLLDVLKDVTIPRSKIASLQSTLVEIFETAVCKFGTARSIALRNSDIPDDDGVTTRDLSILVVLTGEIKKLLEKHELSALPFAGCMSRTIIVTSLIELIALDPVVSDADLQNSPTQSSLRLLYAILELTRAADQLMYSGLHRLFLDSKVGKQIQNDHVVPYNSPELHSIWTDGILPLVLLTSGILGNRLKDEMTIFVTAFGTQIETNFTSWSKPQIIMVSQLQELHLLLFLISSLERMHDQKNEGLSETKSILAGNIAQLLSHPRTTTAIVQPAQDQDTVMQMLQEVLEYLREE